MARCPFAVWRPLIENQTQGDITPTQVILHSAVDAPGPTSLFGYFNRADITVESHFYVRNDGTIEQYLDTTVRADANRYANPRAISIETEDDGDPNQRPWNAAQVASIIRLVEWLCDTHGIPKVQCPAWDKPGIGWHSMWGAPSNWTPARGKTCPGTARIPQAREIIARLGAGATTTATEEDDMALIVRGESTPEWWITDGLHKDHIETADVAGGLAFVGLAKWNNGGPFIVGQAWIDSIPQVAKPSNVNVTIDPAEVARQVAALLPAQEATALAKAILAEVKAAL